MGLVVTPIERLTQDSRTAASSPAAETAILTTTTVTSGRAGVANASGFISPVKINAVINITPGTGATAIVVSARQGPNVAGTLLSALTASCTAALPLQLAFQFRDFSSFLQTGGQYTITVAETGASVAGTVNDIDVVVEN